jgi:hypothetical protein
MTYQYDVDRRDQQWKRYRMSMPEDGGPPAEFPNSVAQRERIRMLLEYGPTGRLRHCLTVGIEIHGKADDDDLSARLTRLIKRRPALSSVFVDESTHRLTRDTAVGLRRQHIDAPTPKARWAIANHIAGFEAERPFQLGDRPLVRATLLTTEEDRHLLVVCLDPLVCDAWSANLVVKDLLADDLDESPDAYPTAWLSREAWLAGPEGQAAVHRRRQQAADAWRCWPVPVDKDVHDPDETIERFIPVDDAVVALLRDKVRWARGSLLAVGALALACSAATDATAPLALRTTVAGRATRAEETIVGWFANEAVLRIPPRNGTVLQLLTALRAEIFAALGDQRVPYALVDPSLSPGVPDGPSCALVFLPSGLSGGQQVGHRLGDATATRTAVSVCPTGADIDFFMIEDMPPVDDRPRALLAVGAGTRRAVASPTTIDQLLERWLAALGELATCDWERTPVAEIS